MKSTAPAVPRRRRTLTLGVVMTLVATLFTSIDAPVVHAAEPVADAPLRMTVSSENPLLLTQMNIGNDMGKTEGFAREYNDGWSMGQIWASVPDDVKGNIGFVLHQGHNEESDANPDMSARWLEDNVAEADELGIPVFILWDEGRTLISNQTRWQFLEHLYRTYDTFMGTVVSEQADTLGDLPEALRIANQYGGFHILGSLEETNQLASRMETQSYWDSVSKYKQNFIFNPKNFHENFETVNAWTQGAWLAGAFDNWGPYFDGYPYYTCGTFGVRTAYSNCGDRWSRSIAETVSSMMMLDQWQAGATVFHLENQLDMPTDGSFYSPYFYQSILPAMRYMLEHDGPDRAQIIERTKVAFSEVEGPISGLPDSTAAGRGGNPNRTTFFSMYEQAPALTAVQKQMWFYLRSSGRYGIVPRIPKLAPAALVDQLRAGGATVLTKSTYGPAMGFGDTRGALFDTAYPAISTGDAFVQKSGASWLVYNSNDRDNFAQDASLLLTGSTFTRLEMPQITPHTWAMVTEDGASLDVRLNTYRTDREADLLSVGGVRDMEFNRNFVEYAYVPNPHDDALRTTTLRVEVGTQPQLTISGYDGNQYDYQEHYDASSNTYTLTVQSNGVVDIRLTTGADDAGWTTLPSSQVRTDDGGLDAVFDGTSVRWTGASAGAVTVDGVAVGNAGSGAVHVTGLSNGVHTLRIEGATGGEASYVPSVEHSATSVESNDFTYGSAAEDEDVLYGSDGWRVTEDGRMKLVGYVFPFYGDTTVYNTNVKASDVRYESSLSLVNGTSGSLMVRGDEKGKLGYFFRLDPLRVNDGRNGTAGYSCSLHKDSAGSLNGGWAPVATCDPSVVLQQNRSYDVVVEARGDTITASIDGAQVLTVTGAVERAGYTGVRSPAAQSYAGTFGQFVELDDATVTDLATSKTYSTDFSSWTTAKGWMTETPLVFGWNDREDPRSSFTFPWEWDVSGGEMTVVENDVFTSGLVGHGRLSAGNSNAVATGGAESDWAEDGDYDYWAWVKVTAGNQGGLVVRGDDAGDGYQARVDVEAGSVELGTVVDGEWARLAQADVEGLARDEWILVKTSVRGPLITVSVAGREVLSAADDRFETGAAGIWTPKGGEVDVDEARVVARPALPLTDARTALTTVADVSGVPQITGYDLVSVKTARTEQPALPATVTARYSDGSRHEVDVTWPALTTAQLNTATAPTADGPSRGIHVVSGTVAGSAMPVPATVMVMPNLTTPLNVTGTYSSAAPSIPNQVPGLGTFSDGTRTWTKYLYVRWQDTPQTAPGSPNTQTITGTVGGAPWQTVTATIAVTPDKDPTDPGSGPDPEPVPANLALGASVKTYFTASNAARVPAKIVDGDLATAWYTGGSSDGSFSDGTAASTQGSLCSWVYVDLGADATLSSVATQFGENLSTFGSMFNAPYSVQVLTDAEAAAHTEKERNSSVCTRRSGGNYGSAATGSEYVVTPDEDIWRTVATGTGTATLASLDLAQVDARYVRILTNEPATAHRYGTAIYELQVWGLRDMTNTTAPAVTGTRGIGSVLEANAGAWSIDDPEVRFQWMRDGQPIDGARSPKYTLTEADLGAAVTVRVRAFRDGFAPGEAGSNVVTPVAAPTATIKDGATFTVRTGETYAMISFKLYSAQKIDRVVLNGTTKDLTDNQWSDVNFIRPSTFGAVTGVNVLVVYDAEGNSKTSTFVLN
ncbi:Ig-like domain-containing protein [Microbacterium sp. C5A9]|uniref:glycosyl hydrolase family 98 C-terminal domain-containing protein n=1 Tax=Microbacterium sp. C5A9 TaxID=2736663 RepID=UPI001F5162DA|nr:glycosyl hydrolase family 98 C-terminal domain-containing protein [Microbacterium sp. C5A9]MCI1017240.1 Ig-like domain-containing protein [Microbacterium sp. C5A9]